MRERKSEVEPLEERIRKIEDNLIALILSKDPNSDFVYYPFLFTDTKLEPAFSAVRDRLYEARVIIFETTLKVDMFIQNLEEKQPQSPSESLEDKLEWINTNLSGSKRMEGINLFDKFLPIKSDADFNKKLENFEKELSDFLKEKKELKDEKKELKDEKKENNIETKVSSVGIFKKTAIVENEITAKTIIDFLINILLEPHNHKQIKKIWIIEGENKASGTTLKLIDHLIKPAFDSQKLLFLPQVIRKKVLLKSKESSKSESPRYKLFRIILDAFDSVGQPKYEKNELAYSSAQIKKIFDNLRGGVFSEILDYRDYPEYNRDHLTLMESFEVSTETPSSPPKKKS